MKKIIIKCLALSCVVKTITFLTNAKSCLKNAFNAFLKCGLIGWCIEILYTSLLALRRRDMTLTGHTSLWMFPIYGSAFLIRPFSRLIRGRVFWVRGLFYAFFIYLVEFISGRLLMKKHACPWNYHHSRWQIHDVIRLDFAPFWFFIGLLYEAILNRKSSTGSTK